MNREELSGKASEIAFKKLEDANGKLLNINEPYRTFIIVYSGQSMIDSGGLEYFFQNDFPDKLPYSMFVEAYQNIGATKGAASIEAVVASFGFDEPHLHENKRNDFIDQKYDEVVCGVPEWEGVLSGDESIWDKLGEYVERNIKYFS